MRVSGWSINFIDERGRSTLVRISDICHTLDVGTVVSPIGEGGRAFTPGVTR